MQAVQERHENSVLKSEVDRIREENRCLRESAKNSCCPNCGFVTTNPEAAAMAEDKKLRIENARLKTEVITTPDSIQPTTEKTEKMALN